jgi:hypothetical protein
LPHGLRRRFKLIRCPELGYFLPKSWWSAIPSVLSSRLIAKKGAPSMAEKTILVGVIPEAMVIGPSDQVAWVAGEGQLKIEFDANRCPFASNIFQAPAGMRLLSGPPRPGTKPGSFRYRLWLNDQCIGSGEIIVREK